MAGYWPSSLFACLWTETNTSSQKKTRSISSHLDRTSLVIIWLLGKKVSLRDIVGSPELAKQLHLIHRASHCKFLVILQHGFVVYCTYTVLEQRCQSNFIICNITLQTNAEILRQQRSMELFIYHDAMQCKTMRQLYNYFFCRTWNHANKEVFRTKKTLNL